MPSVPQTACSLCEDVTVYEHEVPLLCLQRHRQHAALFDDANVYEHEAPCDFSVTDSMLPCLTMSIFMNMKCPVPSVSQTAHCSVWRCQCFWEWSALCLQCPRQHAALSDNANVQEHEASCAFSVTESMLLCLKMSVFTNDVLCPWQKKKRERHPCHKHMCHSPSCPVSWSELTKISPHSAQMASKTSKYLPQHCPATVSDAIRAVINLKR